MFWKKNPDTYSGISLFKEIFIILHKNKIQVQI